MIDETNNVPEQELPEETVPAQECPAEPAAAEPEAAAEEAAETPEAADSDKKGKKREKETKKEKKGAEQLASVAAERDRLQAKYDEARDAHLRTLAEYDNFRKRSAREKDSIYPEAIAKALAAFLPAIDAFERGMDCKCTDENFYQGMTMVLAQMNGALEKLGCVAFGEEGEPFDPERHNAVMHVEDEEYAENVVCEVYQKGYLLGDKVIRFAMVKVAN